MVTAPWQCGIPSPTPGLITPYALGTRFGYLQPWLPVVDEAQHRVRTGHADAAVGGRHGAHSCDGDFAVWGLKSADEFACKKHQPIQGIPD